MFIHRRKAHQSVSFQSVKIVIDIIHSYDDDEFFFYKFFNLQYRGKATHAGMPTQRRRI